MLGIVATVLFLLSVQAANNSTVVSKSYDDIRDVVTQTKTIFLDKQEYISSDKFHDVKSNNRPMKERIRKMTRRSTQNVEMVNCSKQVDFNITLAMERGIEFQAEFCSWKCHGNSSSGNRQIDSDCLSTLPSCALCLCDSMCSDYGDCCDGTLRTASINKTDSARADTQPSYTCFQVDQYTAVDIIASCPGRMTSSVGDNSQSNFTLQPGETHTITGVMSEAVTADIQCNTCLSSPELNHLITSGATGDTYCNHHCLYCNEKRRANDIDFLWRKQKSCMAENNSIGNVSSSKNKTGSTDGYCQTVFETPENMSFKHCDSNIHSIVNNNTVRTCTPDLQGNKCNLSSDVVEKLEQLCQAYQSPVYTDEAIYQNIFCYLCQGHVPLPCLEVEISDDTYFVDNFDGNLGTLTDMTGDILQGDIAEQEEPEDGNNGKQTSKVNCQDDDWEDEMKGICYPSVCAPGRVMANNTTSRDAYCKMDDDQDKKDIYKLHVIVYLPTTDVYSGSSVLRSGNICSSKHANMYVDETYLEYEDSMENKADLVSTLTLEFKILCEELGNSYHMKGNLAQESKMKQNQNEKGRFVNSKQDIKHLPTATGRTMSHATPDSHRESRYESTKHRTPRGVHAVMGDNLMAHSRSHLVRSVKSHIMSALKTLRVADFFFQLYHLRTNNTRSQSGQPTGSPGGAAESSASDSQAGIATILFMRLPSGIGRDVFESDIINHFNGMKRIVIDTAVVNVEMVLSVSEEVIITGHPVYHVDSLNRECHVFTETDQLTQLPGDMFCSGDKCRIVPLNLVSSCPYVTLNISDFNLSKDCELNKDGINIRKSQYILENDLVNICSKTLSSLFKSNIDIHNKVPLMARIESLLTLISLSMSITCLVMTFITYLTFPTLRSLPGKNNMVMVMWLFVAQLLVILNTVPTKHSTACTVMGILLHYSWLFTVLWTCACSFHMFHVFVLRRGAPSSRRSHAFYLARYLIICSVITVLIVLSVVISKVYQSSYDNIGYGGHICYLNSNVLVGVAFVLPLSVVLLFNFFFFSVTIYTISHIGDVKRQSGRERRNIHIYFRLSSLTGLCWILALLAEIPGLRPLRCFSVLVNGCQGIALFLSYVCNRRVARMWLHLLKSKCTGLYQKPEDSSRQVTFSSSL